eukprot:CAMPEP_0119118664 /NCGR_PEP_ID=MMETSP1310-20130426/465_1 /TAXON_ID=464262 /ORGANISM="Genus nov. species nov., Strain RCC2339" /LENGTH=601 /DNA_ID=CAMNT_0007108051 /DNA_START=60 /DNA_END=1865 /DNA_ORIENTATION=+
MKVGVVVAAVGLLVVIAGASRRVEDGDRPLFEVYNHMTESPEVYGAAELVERVAELVLYDLPDIHWQEAMVDMKRAVKEEGETFEQLLLRLPLGTYDLLASSFERATRSRAAVNEFMMKEKRAPQTKAETRNLCLHLDVELPSPDFFCEVGPQAWWAFTCLVRSYPFPDEDLPGGIGFLLPQGCDGGGDFNGVAFLTFQLEVARVARGVLDLACQGLPDYLPPLAAVRLATCMTRYPLDLVIMLYESMLETIGLNDNNADSALLGNSWDILNNFIWEELDCRQGQSYYDGANYRKKTACNGVDDNCNGIVDDCAEDFFAPEITVPYPSDLGWHSGDDDSIAAILEHDICEEDCQERPATTTGLDHGKSVVQVGDGECFDRTFQITCEDTCGNNRSETINAWTDREAPVAECGFGELGLYYSYNRYPAKDQFVDVEFVHQHFDDCFVKEIKLEVYVSENSVESYNDPRNDVIIEQVFDAIEEDRADKGIFRVFLRAADQYGDRWYLLRLVTTDIVGNFAVCNAWFQVVPKYSYEPVEWRPAVTDMFLVDSQTALTPKWRRLDDLPEYPSVCLDERNSYARGGRAQFIKTDDGFVDVGASTAH